MEQAIFIVVSSGAGGFLIAMLFRYSKSNFIAGLIASMIFGGVMGYISNFIF